MLEVGEAGCIGDERERRIDAGKEALRLLAAERGRNRKRGREQAFAAELVAGYRTDMRQRGGEGGIERMARLQVKLPAAVRSFPTGDGPKHAEVRRHKSLGK